MRRDLIIAWFKGKASRLKICVNRGEGNNFKKLTSTQNQTMGIYLNKYKLKSIAPVSISKRKGLHTQNRV
jgi:hypothetical protein